MRRKRGEVKRGPEGLEKAKEARNSHREIPSKCVRAGPIAMLNPAWCLWCRRV